MEYTIYVITNEVNGKEYVGVTSQPAGKRFGQHKYNARKGVNTHLYNSIRKYQPAAFDIQVVEFASTKDRALALEQEWIADLDTFQGEGYNSTPGGEGCKRHTEETKRKISEARKGKCQGQNNPMYDKGHSDETRRRISEALQGRELSEKHKQKLSEVNSGKEMSEEARQKMSEAARGERGHNPKLNRKQAQTIKALAIDGRLTQKQIGRMFDVSDDMVSKIKLDKAWSHIDPKPPADDGQLRFPFLTT